MSEPILFRYFITWAASHILSHVLGSLLMTAVGFALVNYLKS